MKIPKPVLTKVSEIQRKQVRWLWKGRIPLGKLTLLLGDPGEGKSLFGCAIIAKRTRGEPLPGDEDIHHEPGPALIISSEDDPEDALRPRLEDMGADLSRVTILSGLRSDKGEVRGITLKDIEALSIAIEEVHPEIVMLDPLIAYTAGKDTNAASQVRELLTPVITLAQKYGFALIGIMHLNKSDISKALYRGQGSMDFIGAARSVFLIAPDPIEENQKIICHIKSNYSKKSPSWSFRLEQRDGDNVHFEWGGKSPYTAENLMGAQQGGRANKVELGESLLMGVLSRGPHPTAKVERLAENMNISEETLNRARKSLEIKSYRVGGIGENGIWMLALPGF